MLTRRQVVDGECVIKLAYEVARSSGSAANSVPERHESYRVSNGERENFAKTQTYARARTMVRDEFGRCKVY